MEARILRLAGPFTLNSVFEFQSAAREIADPVIIVDLSGVPYMDSAALGALLGLHCSCERQRKHYALAGASDRLLSVFDVAGVNTLLVTYPTIEEAETGLSAKGAAAG